MENKAYPKIKNAILLCLLFLGISTGIGGIAGAIFGLFEISLESAIFGIITILINVLAFSLVIYIGYKKSRQSFNEVFKFNKVSLNYWLAITILMFGFVILSSELNNIVVFFLPMPQFMNDIFAAMMTKQGLIISIILVVIVPAIAEELLFRGVILDGFRKNYSEKKAILISALFFGIIHLNPWQFVTAFIIGIIAAWVLIKTNSIILCVYMHLLNNLASVILPKFGEVLPIKGFNIEGGFQPIWFDLAGLVITALGVIILTLALKKGKIPNPCRK